MANAPIPMNSVALKSILVATDFSETANHALKHGIAIARHYGATLYVVYVVSSIWFTLTGPESVELVARASERDIDLLLNELVGSGRLKGIEVRPVVLKGNIDEEVESFARAHQVDLVVVSTHGRCGMARLVFGSVAQLISKCCSCPVLTVGPHSCNPWLDSPADSGKPLLFATTFSKACAKALPYAISLANDLERQLFLLHVLPPHHVRAARRDGVIDHEASALAHLNTIIPLDANLKCTPTLLVESCGPADGILRVAKRIHAVTIIMGVDRDSNSDLTTRLPGSVTDHVNREAICQVLTVRG